MAASAFVHTVQERCIVNRLLGKRCIDVINKLVTNANRFAGSLSRGLPRVKLSWGQAVAIMISIKRVECAESSPASI